MTTPEIKSDSWHLVISAFIIAGLAFLLFVAKTNFPDANIVPIDTSPTSTATGIPMISTIQPSRLQTTSSPRAPIETQGIGVIKVSWNDYSAVSIPEWLSNSIAELAASADSIGKYSITVDISKNELARATTAYTNEEWKIFSPKRAFVIECRNGLHMYWTSDMALISETPLQPELHPGLECATFIEWAPDETIVSFVDQDNAIYTWRSNGEAPKRITNHLDFTLNAWSPNSKMLAFPRSVPNLQSGMLDIVDADGNLLHEFQFTPGGDGPILGWATNSLIISYSRYSIEYYDIDTGQLVLTWKSTYPGFHQRPQLSPDNRWVFMDQGGQEFSSQLEANHIVWQIDYSLNDLEEKKVVPLLSYLGNYVVFAGWNKDSSKLFLVNRPAEAVTVSDPEVPFGLLSYDIYTGQFELLFEDAMQVAWNTDKTMAFVVFRKRDHQQNWFLEGGLWKAGTRETVAEQRLYDQVIYQLPVFDTLFYVHNGPISIAWSNNGQMVAFRDITGKIKLINVDGTEKVLLAEDFDQTVSLRWSPDDHHLLIETDGHGWIVDIISP